MGGRGWTELAQETPEFHSCLAPTPATLSNFATFCNDTQNVHELNCLLHVSLAALVHSIGKRRVPAVVVATVLEIKLQLVFVSIEFRS